MAALLIEVDTEDLILRECHLVEGIDYLPLLARSGRQASVAAARKDGMVVGHRPPGLPAALDDEDGVGHGEADAGTIPDR